MTLTFEQYRFMVISMSTFPHQYVPVTYRRSFPAKARCVILEISGGVSKFRRT